MTGRALIALALAAGLVSAGAAEPLRIAVTAVSPDVSDRVAAALSHDDNMVVLERGQIDLLLQEGSLSEFSRDGTRRAQLGRLLSLDYFVNVRSASAGSTGCLLEIVNGQTGELAESETIRSQLSDTDALARAAAKFLEERFLGKPVHKADGLGALRVAVLDFSSEDTGNPEAAANALCLSTEARNYLGGRGIQVLDRMLTQQVAGEHGLGENGLELAPKDLPLLGADAVVCGKVVPGTAGLSLELTLLDTRHAGILAAQRFPLVVNKQAVNLPDDARTWLIQTLHPGEIKPAPVEEKEQVEALVPFYAGIEKFDAGRYLEATADFQKAYLADTLFQDARVWEARCYDAVGLTRLAAAVRRFIAANLYGTGFATWGEEHPDHAVTFLGVTGGQALDDRLVGEKIEMLAVDSLAGATRLQLTSRLNEFRDEYDVLVGTKNVLGVRWSDVPGFLTDRSLRGELSAPDSSGGRKVTWTLVDNVSGKTLGQVESVLAGDGRSWGETVSKKLKELCAAHPDTDAPSTPVRAAPLPTVAELDTQVDSARGGDINVPLLGLLIQNPEDPRLLKYHLKKDGGGNEMDGFLNFALRDVLIERLPANSPELPWLELARLGNWIPETPFIGTGDFFSGKTIDPQAELKKFIDRHPDDLPGCVATYMWLYPQLGDMPPEELARRLDDLEKKLEGHTSEELGNLHLLRDTTDALLTTALIATGTRMELPLPTTKSAFRVFVEFDADGKPRVVERWHWRTMEWREIADADQHKVEEARASLAILGRREGEGRFVKPEWMRDFPDSVIMLTFAIDTLHEVDHILGQPHMFPLDADAQRQHFRDIVAYCNRGLLREIDAAANPAEVTACENWVDEFVRHMCEWAYLDTVPDSEFEAMRKGLEERIDAANNRVGRTVLYPPRGPYVLDWRVIQRRPTDMSMIMNVWVGPEEYRDTAALLKHEQEVGQRSWEESPVQDREWTGFVHSYAFTQTFPPAALAKVYLQHLTRVNEIFPARDYSPDEIVFLVDYGKVLLQGGDLTDAEPILARVVASPDSDLNRYGEAPARRAYAALELALIYRAWNRPAEALAMAERAEQGKGDALSLHIISELRTESNQEALPPQVRAFTVRTANVTNAKLTYYVHVPAGYDPHAKKPYPILIVVPANIQSALSCCLDASPWARFADQQGLFIVSPDFIHGDDWETSSPSLGRYSCPAVWSGPATLDALNQIRAQYNVRTDHLLLHGFAGGSQFVHRFAMWRPDLCLAISSHGSEQWSWFDFSPGLNPLSALRNIHCLVSCGEEDDQRRGGNANRLDMTEQWVTMARGAGVPVIWKTFRNAQHLPIVEMEEMSRAFLAHYLHSDGDKPLFVGDLRTWRYYPAEDARVKAIPKNFQEPLPTVQLAQMWGTAEP